MATTASIRELRVLTDSIIKECGRLSQADTNLKEAQDSKESIVQSIGRAEAKYASLVQARDEESQNTVELSNLQRCGGILNGRLQELVKSTKAARGRRDAAREAALGAYYTRRGVELEALRATSSSNGCRGFELSGTTPAWGPQALLLLGEAGGVWRKVSDASIVAREVAEGAVQLMAGLTLDAEDEETPALLSSAGVLYAALGVGALASDAQKALATVKDLSEAVEGLCERCRKATPSLEGEGDSDETDEAGAPQEDADTTSALQTLLSILKVNLKSQQDILEGAIAALSTTNK